ncbi:MAG TPA: MFS transporter [bacterium]|nr:MFS transporter [bacterium]
MSDSSVSSLLRDRKFRILYAALLISGIGAGISRISLLWLAYHLTGSTVTMALVFICFTLPGLLVSPISGAIADKYPKRDLFIGASVVIGVVVLLFPIAYHTGSLTILYGAVVLKGIALAFKDGPMRAYLPELFAEEQLPAVNAMLENNRSLVIILGPAIGGFMLGFGYVDQAFILDSLSFMTAAGLFLLLPRTRNALSEGTLELSRIMGDIREGMKIIAASPIHRFLLLLFVVLNGFSCMIGGLYMPFSEDILSPANGLSGGTIFAMLETTVGVGAFVGTLFISRIMEKAGPLRTLMLGSTLLAFEILLYGLVPNIFVLIPVTLVTANAIPLLLVPFFTLLQQKTAPDFRGRVMGATESILLTIVSLAFGLGGVLAQVVGILPLFITSGVLLIASMVVIMLLPLYRALRTEEQQELQPQGVT